MWGNLPHSTKEISTGQIGLYNTEKSIWPLKTSRRGGALTVRPLVFGKYNKGRGISSTFV